LKVLTYGTFDLFHIGHLNILKRAKELGEHLTVAVSTDEFNLDSKKKKSAQPFQERAEIVRAIKYVDDVIAEESWEQKVRDIKSLEIDIFVIGDDWSGDFNFLREYCQVVYLSRTKGISTTGRKEQIIRNRQEYR